MKFSLVFSRLKKNLATRDPILLQIEQNLATKKFGGLATLDDQEAKKKDKKSLPIDTHLNNTNNAVSNICFNG